MSTIHNLIIKYWTTGRKIKSTLNGWLVGNAPCCHHRGHNPDRRGRGNLMLSPDGAIVYNCYNCQFKTKFDGYNISKKFESLMIWMGIPNDDIRTIKLELLKNQLEGTDPSGQASTIFQQPDFKEIPLPNHSYSIEEVAGWDEPPEEYLRVLGYLASRGDAISSNYDFYWSSSHKNQMCDRLILPFYHRGKIVGWTARYAGDPPAPSIPRYFNSELQMGYVFNDSALHRPERDLVLLVEGPFDAIAIDGVAALGSKLSREQIAWLESGGKEIVLLPDRQRKNQGLIDVALERGWSVSFPDWEDDVKDAADAAKRYGRIYTVRSAIASKTRSRLEINLKRQLFRN